MDINVINDNVNVEQTNVNKAIRANNAKFIPVSTNKFCRENESLKPVRGNLGNGHFSPEGICSEDRNCYPSQSIKVCQFTPISETDLNGVAFSVVFSEVRNK